MKNTPALTLISHHLCPFVQRPAIVLREKNVPFERINILLNNKPEWFLTLSPTGKVPLLKLADGVQEHILFESMAICEFLEDSYPEHHLYPELAVDRARHRAWIEFLTPLQAAAWLSLLPSTEDKDSKRAEFAQGLKTIEGILGDSPYFAGERFGMVDAAAAPIFRFFDVLGERVDQSAFDGLPRIQAWREALRQRPSVRDAVSENYPAELEDRLFGVGTR